MEFKLTESESKKAEEFKIEHLHKEVCQEGHLVYTIMPTSIGNCVAIKCCICNKEEDLTDYNSW